MRSSSNTGSGEGQPHCPQTDIRKRHGGHRKTHLFVVGIGPGDPDYLPPRARKVIEEVPCIAGYTTYLDLIRPLIRGKKIVDTGMKKEVERVTKAIDMALTESACAVVCSGDPGIYAMATLVFEICRKRRIIAVPPFSEDPDMPFIRVEIVPGIPALASGAALLGAPLSHDFAVISLSDLLTPWHVIEKRIEAAAQADFVIVIYNPKSKKRSWQLEKAAAIVSKYRNPNTPVGIITKAMRPGQTVSIVPLRGIGEVDVTMQTTLFIGSSQSAVFSGYMVTPRGYGTKYSLGE